MTDLRAYLDTASQQPFRYGRHDCCTFAARWIVLCGGPDLLVGRGYTSLRSGLQRAAQEGYDDHLPVLDMACHRVPVLQARAGDLAVFVQGRVPAVGIVRPGGEDVLSLSASGAGIAPLVAADYCLRVR
jgi:hypothetical protein